MLWSDSPYFVFGKSQVGRLHSKSRILRLVPRRSTFLPHKGDYYRPLALQHNAADLAGRP